MALKSIVHHLIAANAMRVIPGTPPANVYPGAIWNAARLATALDPIHVHVKSVTSKPALAVCPVVLKVVQIINIVRHLINALATLAISKRYLMAPNVNPSVMRRSVVMPPVYDRVFVSVPRVMCDSMAALIVCLIVRALVGRTVFAQLRTVVNVSMIMCALARLAYLNAKLGVA